MLMLKVMKREGAAFWGPLLTRFDRLYDLTWNLPNQTKQQQKSILSHSELAFH